MSSMLSSYFEAIAFKRLSPVEATSRHSNQHEFNGIGNLKAIFGDQKKEIDVVQIYLDDKQEEPVLSKTTLTWYDAREQHPTRTEYRLYYRSTPVTDSFNAGDLMIIAKSTNGLFLNLIAKQGSSSENQLKLLFNISEAANTIETRKISGAQDSQVDSIRNFILEKLGFSNEESHRDDDGLLQEMLGKFPDGLPSTRVFSGFARDISAVQTDNPDELIMEWWNVETRLFKLYERHLFESRKDKDQSDIDAFIALSLKLSNTRKARAGSALENHVEEIFVRNNVSYSRTQITENNSKPDFIFPNIESYRNLNFSAENLHMLAVKTTCKDRWRQVLPEADRISHKHLLTLEPGISKNQTDQMRSHNLTLVLPEQIHSSFTADQSSEILSIKQFLNLVG